jgi:hypothetical protein
VLEAVQRCLELRTRESKLMVAVARLDSAASKADCGKPEGRRSPMPVADSNKRAMELVKDLGIAFYRLSETEQAKRIGCHLRTWRKTDLYKTAKEKRLAGQTPKGRKAVTLTEAVEATVGVGNRDEVLNHLITDERDATAKRSWEDLSREEQEAFTAGQDEPSPLEDDPPSRPRRKVVNRKSY